jgi:DNA-directed RNA polymerase subunit E'/Rpb7
MSDIFIESILSTNIQLKPDEYNQSIDDIILEKIKSRVEGKCDKNGYIKENSVSIIKRSIGSILQAQFNGNCTFKIWYKVLCCNPTEGMIIKCSVLNRNKMGLFCELYDHKPSPLTIILAKQHHLRDDRYEDVKIGSYIDVEIVGIKFEYNDTQISCIGRLYDSKSEDKQDNGEEEYYQEEDEEDLEEEMEHEIEIPDIKEEKPKPKSLIDLMTSSGENETEKVGSGKAETMGSMIDEPMDENLDLNLEAVDLNNSDHEEENVLEDELSLNFEGVKLDLNNEAEKNTESVHLTEKQENIEKLTYKVYDLEIKKCDNDKCIKLVEPSKTGRLKRSYITYYNYSLLNNMFVEYFQKNNKKPSKILINSNYQYKDDMNKFIKGYLSHMSIEETEELTHIV